jgi:hypothetical protein
MERFVWESGVGIDGNALARLRIQFKRPSEPMGEAWFMGENRRMFHGLNGDLCQLSARALQEPLEEITSGTSSFGPMAEWNSWYHYPLAQLLPRSHESFVDSLLESLVTGFIALHPNGVHAEGFMHIEDLVRSVCRVDAQGRVAAKRMVLGRGNRGWRGHGHRACSRCASGATRSREVSKTVVIIVSAWGPERGAIERTR